MAAKTCLLLALTLTAPDGLHVPSPTPPDAPAPRRSSHFRPTCRRVALVSSVKGFRLSLDRSRPTRQPRLHHRRREHLRSPADGGKPARRSEARRGRAGFCPGGSNRPRRARPVLSHQRAKGRRRTGRQFSTVSAAPRAGRRYAASVDLHGRRASRRRPLRSAPVPQRRLRSRRGSGFCSP